MILFPSRMGAPLALALLLSGAATAQQTSTARFKAPRPLAIAPLHVSGVQTRIDGQVADRLTRTGGPSAAPMARLAALPLPEGTANSGLRVGVRAERAPETGLPIFIEAQPLGGGQRPVAGPPLEASLQFVEQLKDVLGVQQPRREFVVTNISAPDEVGQTHVRLRQTWAGLPVYGAEVIVHLDVAGQPSLLTGRYFRSPVGLSTHPVVTDGGAISRTVAALRTRTTVRPLTAPEQHLLHYTAPWAELVVYHPDLRAAPKLAWHVTAYPNVLERWETFVDAGSGQLIEQYMSSCSANGPRTATAPDLNGVTQTVNTYEQNGNFYMLDASRPMFNLGTSNMPDDPTGGILTVDAQGTAPGSFSFSHVASPTNTWTATNRRAAISAHYNAGEAFSYYKNVHNRNSIDGQGGTIVSIVHVADDNGGGLDNAYWNGQAMFYGDGAQSFRPLAGGLDVGGHEMTHGVIQHTANLEYRTQSGAINEHMADVFGAMMDRSDWLLGEDVVQPGVYPGGALRSLSDPHNGTTASGNGWQPRTMSEFYAGPDDNGGVHINSGIPNWAYYKFATAISKDHGEQIWYRALSTYLTRSSQFLDLRLATIRAATDLYGAGSADVTALGTAFDQVGITGTQPSPGPGVLAANPGPDLLLTYDTDPNFQGTIYVSATTGASGTFRRITDTPSISKPSVNDAGTIAVFVDDQHFIRAVNLTGSANETVLSNQGVWHNAAISKDGTKLAAVTTQGDTAIYVFDLAGGGQGARFHLYIPTSGGVQGSGVRYADALEWDYTGQLVIYDAYNVIRNASGQDYDFWNINFLRVWSNVTNTWSDGHIEQLVPSLPDGISIGNPALSKRSPNIMGFDMLDANGGASPFSVMAVNLDNGNGGTIFGGTAIPGTPSYSKLDNKVVFAAMSTGGDSIVAAVDMGPDKITPTGNAAIVVTAAKWPTWLSQGTRQLPNATPREIEADMAGFHAWPNPATDQLLLEADQTSTVTLFNMLGQAVRTAHLTAGERQQLALADLPAGTYLLRATDAKQHAVTRRIVKQ